MSSMINTVNTLDSISYYLTISTTSFILIFGTIGNILNVIIFLSLKTFRQNPCAFCLMILSISDSGVLLFSAIPYIFNIITKNYSGINALFSCKIPMCFGQTFALMSHCIMCYAAIDQYISTSMNERFKGMTIKFLRRLILISIFVCIIHGIPFLIYYDAQTLPGENITICRLKDSDGPFSKYVLYVAFPIIGGFLPILIMITFAFIALRNVRKMSRRRIHIIRLRLEQQLTAMVLIKIFNVCFTIVPFFLVYMIRYIIFIRNDDPSIQKLFMLIIRIITLLLFINYGDNFYIFFLSSIRFRRQLKFVLLDIYLKKWRAKRNNNRIEPNPERFVLSIISNFERPQFIDNTL